MYELNPSHVPTSEMHPLSLGFLGPCRFSDCKSLECASGEDSSHCSSQDRLPAFWGQRARPQAILTILGPLTAQIVLSLQT